ncbi:MAG: DNA/RNA nuclease SfsA, partial [Thermodesulfovibrio sp.]|nr:DNA/RNA nuclease SfsA [Thermodesulfovibrio sp.]
MINYPFNFEKINATFVSRENRFLVKAQLNENIIDCYLPNPGRLWELLIPGETELILVRNTSSSKIPFLVLACKKEDKLVLLHTHITNKIIKALINDQKLNPFKGFRVISEEVKIERSRFDLLLENSNDKLYLEVKTCTLFGNRVAMFPDAITERGRRHLMELNRLAENGIKTSVIFVVMNPDVEFFLPAYHIDYQFAKAFMNVKNLVNLKAIALDWDKHFNYVKKVKELKIPFSFIEKTLNDRGVYLLITQLNSAEFIKIGKIGEKHFPAGYYVYVGKAKKGLFSRIERHRRKLKKMHWHIDYLLKKARLIKDLPIVTDENIECTLADRLLKISDGALPEFGSSDCYCKSHLFYFRENPLHKRDF